MAKEENIELQKRISNATTNGALGGVSCITPFDLTIPKHVEEHLELIEKLEDEMGINCCKMLAIPPDKQGK